MCCRDSAAIQNVLNVTGMTVLNNFAASYGSDVVAAMGIAQRAGMVPLYISMGIGRGIMPLISYTYAGEKFERMKKRFFFAGNFNSVHGCFAFCHLWRGGFTYFTVHEE